MADLARRVARAVAAARGEALELPASDDKAIDKCAELLGAMAAARSSAVESTRAAAVGAAKAPTAGALQGRDVEAQGTGPLLLFVDAVNQLDRDHLRWLPTGQLSADVRVLISSTPKELEGIREGLRFKPSWLRKPNKPSWQEHAARNAPTMELSTPPADLISFLLRHESKTLWPEHVAILTRQPHSASPLWLKLTVDVLLQDGKFEALGDKQGLIEGGRRGLLLELAEEGVADLAARLFRRAEERCGELRVGLLATLCSYAELPESVARKRLLVAETIASTAPGDISDAEWYRLRTALGFLWQPFAGSRAALKVAHAQLEDAVFTRFRFNTKLASLKALKSWDKYTKALNESTGDDLDTVLLPELRAIALLRFKNLTQFPRIYAAIKINELPVAMALVNVDDSDEVHTATRALREGVCKGLLHASVRADVELACFCSEPFSSGVWTRNLYFHPEHVLQFFFHEPFSLMPTMRCASNLSIAVILALRYRGWHAIFSAPLLAVLLALDTPRLVLRILWVATMYALLVLKATTDALWVLITFFFRILRLPCVRAWRACPKSVVNLCDTIRDVMQYLALMVFTLLFYALAIAGAPYARFFASAAAAIAALEWCCTNSTNAIDPIVPSALMTASIG